MDHRTFLAEGQSGRNRKREADRFDEEYPGAKERIQNVTVEDLRQQGKMRYIENRSTRVSY